MLCNDGMPKKSFCNIILDSFRKQTNNFGILLIFLPFLFFFIECEKDNGHVKLNGVHMFSNNLLSFYFLCTIILFFISYI